MYNRVRSGANLVCRAARAVPATSDAAWSCLSQELSTGRASLHTAIRGVANAQPASHLVQLGSWAHSGNGWHITQQVAGFASKGGKGKGGGGKGGGKGHAAEAQQSAEAAGGEGGAFDMAPFESAMTDSLAALRHELGGIRTGRANPGMLEAVVVEASSHGPGAHLKALGTVVARGPQLLAVEVYNKEDAEAVAQAIQKSVLKFQARVEGGEVLVPVPRMTLEMAERLVKLAGQEAEEARAGVRRARHRALEAVKKAFNAGGVPTDTKRRWEAEVQALTDRYIREVDAALEAKERDLRENH